MDLGLDGKVAIVTGSSRGIGLGIAKGLGLEGCKVLICARDQERLQNARNELEEAGIDVLALDLDLTETSTGEELVTRATERWGGVDVLVNNVGGNRRGRFVDTTEDDWEAIVDLNLRVHIRATRAAIPSMRARGGGSILFVSSIFGREAGGAGLSIYNSTKSAVISLSKILALELGEDGIRVNSIAPGSIRFPGGSWDKRCLDDPHGMEKFVEENFAIGRFGTVEEVANAAAFLSSDCASLITGACLNVDGGQSRSLF